VTSGSLPPEVRDDVLAEQPDRLHDRVVRNAARLHEADDTIDVGPPVGVELPDASLRVPDDHDIRGVEILELHRPRRYMGSGADPGRGSRDLKRPDVRPGLV
jgi:hypothetical protein